MCSEGRAEFAERLALQSAWSRPSGTLVDSHPRANVLNRAPHHHQQETGAVNSPKMHASIADS
jgi:hypothetical protein